MRDSAAAEFAAPRGPMLGALYMTAAVCAFAAMTMMIRFATDDLPVLEVVFFRNLFGLLAMTPWLIRTGPGALRTERLGLHLLRGLASFAAMICWFGSIAFLPIAEATAISFVAPAITALFAASFLGERFGAPRALALLCGLLGAAIILRPGAAALSVYAFLPLLAATLWATLTIIVKRLGETESAPAIVAYMTLVTTVLSFPAALTVWRWPDAQTWFVLALLGASASLAHFCLAKALMHADAGFVAALDYLRLPLVALAAWLVFGETSDLWTWLGAAVIAAGAIHLARAERRGPPAKDDAKS